MGSVGLDTKAKNPSSGRGRGAQKVLRELGLSA